MFNFKFTVMREPDLQRIKLFPGFKLLKIFENFKTTFGYYLSNFLCPYFISGQCFNVFFFILEYRSIGEKIDPKKHSGTSLFLVKNIEKVSICFEDD